MKFSQSAALGTFVENTHIRNSVEISVRKAFVSLKDNVAHYNRFADNLGDEWHEGRPSVTMIKLAEQGKILFSFKSL